MTKAELEQRIEHLDKLLYKIAMGQKSEKSFERILKLLEEEYHKEGGDAMEISMGSYHDNLRQTIHKQADSYKIMLKKRPKKGAPDEYESFIYHFRRDVTDELYRCQYKLKNLTSAE